MSALTACVALEAALVAERELGVGHPDVAAGGPVRGRRRGSVWRSVSVGSVGLGVSVAVEESEASGSVAVESESPPQAVSKSEREQQRDQCSPCLHDVSLRARRRPAGGLRGPRRRPPPGPGRPEVRRRGAGRPGPPRTGSRSSSEPCTGCPLASTRVSPGGGRRCEDVASEAGVRGGVPGRRPAGPPPASRLTSRACSARREPAGELALTAAQQRDRLGRQRQVGRAPRSRHRRRPSAAWRCRTPRRTAATAPPGAAPGGGPTTRWTRRAGTAVAHRRSAAA